MKFIVKFRGGKFEVNQLSIQAYQILVKALINVWLEQA